MNSPFQGNSCPISTSSDVDYSFMDMIQEMKELDMDPKPILMTAAHDMFLKYGPKVLVYAQTMLENMIVEKNPNGIYLWNALFDILNEQRLPSPHSLH